LTAFRGTAKSAEEHSMICESRPEEWTRERVLMPAENSMRGVKRGIRQVKDAVKSPIGK
jgi:hypothetical protein